MRTQKTDAPLCRRSEFPLHHQTAGHAFALAGVALHAQVYGQGQVSGGREGDAQFADAGIAVQVRGIDVEAVGGGSRLAVECTERRVRSGYRRSARRNAGGLS